MKKREQPEIMIGFIKRVPATDISINKTLLFENVIVVSSGKHVGLTTYTNRGFFPSDKFTVLIVEYKCIVDDMVITKTYPLMKEQWDSAIKNKHIDDPSRQIFFEIDDAGNNFYEAPLGTARIASQFYDYNGDVLDRSEQIMDKVVSDIRKSKTSLEGICIIANFLRDELKIKY